MPKTQAIVCDICTRQINPAVDRYRMLIVGSVEYVLSDNCKNDADFATKVAALRTTMRDAFLADIQRLRDELGI